MAGLSATGFDPKTLIEIREEINEALRLAFGASVDVSDGSLLGQLAGINAERFSELWELAESVYNSQDPNAATGAALEALASLTGTVRPSAEPSLVNLSLTGTPATLIPSGSIASTASTEDQFETLADAVLVAAAAWAIATAYALGDRVTNSGNVYTCVVAGTSAGSGGPVGTSDANELDNTAEWRYIGAGTGVVDAEAQSVDTGPIVGVSGDITTIETPVAGWDGVKNLTDAVVGADVATDEELRLLRIAEIARAGTGTVDAIRADLLDVENVTIVTVFHNPTDITDGDGVPPHAVEALVQGGADQDLFDKLLDSVAAGIQAYGTTSGTAVDDSGNDQTVAFTRPTEIDIYVDIEVTVDADAYPLDGDDQIKAAIVAYGQLQPTGKDAVSSSIAAQCFTVAGVLDVTVSDIDTAPSPSSPATIPIGTRELAVHDTSRITVVSTPGTP